MYRSLFPVLLCTVAVTSAPQEGKNNDITYLKIQPVTTEPKSPNRESRIENLPLTITGNGNVNVKTVPEDETTARTDFTVSRIHNDPDEVKKENEYDEKSIEDEEIPAREVTEERKPVENQRRARSEDTTTSYEVDTVEPTGVTESELVQPTEAYETRTKAPSPRFISKLSYFQKNNDVRSSITTNLLERAGKRKFRSKCRCEKIWNCPKLQITVPRCPDEYFLCCG